jgi:hypothetical protein
VASDTPSVAGTYAPGVTLSAALREFAEAPERFVEVPAGISLDRLSDERRCILNGKTWATVTGIRVELDEIAISSKRCAASCRSIERRFWCIGPSSRPGNLVEELQQRGFAPPPGRRSESRALVLTAEPEAPDGVEVRRVETVVTNSTQGQPHELHYLSE